MSPLAKVPDALARYKAAEKALQRAIERAYPVGTIVSATLGRARVRGAVTCHCYTVGYIVIENETTGKERKFYAADRSLHDVAIDAYPDCTCMPHQNYHQPPCPLFSQDEPRLRTLYGKGTSQ